MKDYLKLFIFLAALAGVFGSGWMSWAAQSVKDLDENTFLSAHGLSKESYSIWLREHSVWRKNNSTELNNYSFIPKDKEGK